MDRLKALLQELGQQGIRKMLIFCATKKSTEQLCTDIRNMGHFALSIHGDKEQPQRERALGQLKQRSRAILCATDVAQRGLDIPNLPAVINFDMPEDCEDYVHRIGRTGRAGKKGLAISFFVAAKDCGLARGLLKLLQEARQPIPPGLDRCLTMAPPPKRGKGGGKGGGFSGGSNNIPLGGKGGGGGGKGGGFSG